MCSNYSIRVKIPPMRYLGNKESIVNEIVDLLKQKGLIGKKLIFFDAFVGTGTVANRLKENFSLILNDNLSFASMFSTGRVMKGHCKFDKLKLNPIDFFNSNDLKIEGFFSKNYSPSLSGRMYFSDNNAGRIDYFRNKIDEWFNDNLIDLEEKYYLLACLLESVSKVANIAGVYGAYLKTWDPRALKPIKFIEVEGCVSEKKPSILGVYNENISELISKIECDILYIDPPYTKNSYAVQYHILETLVRNDNPTIGGVTGARKHINISNSWSTKYVVDVEFDKIVAETKAKYILGSYSSDGLMSKEYMINVLKRYGRPETLLFKEIPYKKYRNSKTLKDATNHFEYIFFIEKKPKENVVYYCPLNYMGGKISLIEKIKNELTGKSKFVDLMGGGFNVGINTNYPQIIYNDINFIVKDLVMLFRRLDSSIILKKIDVIINKYNLIKNGKEQYINLRNDYNKIYSKQVDQAIYLYTLILYGFQQQIRFNSNYEFNNPVGESSFNDSVREKLVSFSREIKKKNVIFYSKDFEELIDIIDADSIVYVDPPYLITLGSYNDGKRGFRGWNDYEEKRLLSFLERIKRTGCKIVISNILEYNNKKNIFLEGWIQQNEVTVKAVKTRGRQEVIIVYET